MTSADVVGALDIGGTPRLRAAASSVASRRRASGSADLAPLPPRRRAELLAVISRRCPVDRGPGAGRLGVAAPGPVRLRTRRLQRSTHKLDGALRRRPPRRARPLRLRDPAREIVFLNDAEAFVLGEWWAGAARGHVPAVGITLGTGLGSAFLDGGESCAQERVSLRSGELYPARVPWRPGRANDLARAPFSPPTARRATRISTSSRSRHGRWRGAGCASCLRRAGADLAEFLAPWLERSARAASSSGLDRALVGRSSKSACGRSWTRIPGLRAVSAAEQLEDAALLGAAYSATRRS